MRQMEEESYVVSKYMDRFLEGGEGYLCLCFDLLDEMGGERRGGNSSLLLAFHGWDCG